MNTLKKQLKEFHHKKEIIPDENKIRITINQSKIAFYNSAKDRTSTYFEFLYQQGNIIQKKWWIIQFLILVVAWIIIYFENSNYLVQRSMGVLAPLFVILIIPELWKNRSTNSMEIEGAAFYSLRQIYIARILLFAIVDITLLSAFWIITAFTTTMKIDEILIQFLLPLIVTCCICFRTLCSKYLTSEYATISLSMLWSAIWIFIILKDDIYMIISTPIWIGITCCSFVYLIYVIRKLLKECEIYWEVNILWN